MKDKREITRDLLHAKEHLERCRDEFLFAYSVVMKVIDREEKARRITDKPMEEINKKMEGGTDA